MLSYVLYIYIYILSLYGLCAAVKEFYVTCHFVCSSNNYLLVF